jgi:hypothetical protein
MTTAYEAFVASCTVTNPEFQVKDHQGQILWRISEHEDSRDLAIQNAYELQGVPWLYRHDHWQEIMSYSIPVTEETPRGNLLLQLPWGVYRLKALRAREGQVAHVFSIVPGCEGWGETAGLNDAVPVTLNGRLLAPSEHCDHCRVQPFSVTYADGEHSGYLGSPCLTLEPVT